LGFGRSPFFPDYLSFDPRGLLPVLNPLEWTLLEKVQRAGTFLVLTGLIYVFFIDRKNVNLYFNFDTSDVKPGASVALPYRSLVITANLLDEALLGLSAEPVVFGALAPQIRRLFDLPQVRMERRAIGASIAPSDWVRRVFGMATQALLYGVAVVATPIRRWYARSEEAMQRYAFLRDPVLRDEKVKASWLWGQVEPSLAEIESRHEGFPQIDKSLARETLVNTCLTMEERMREWIGAAGFNHSAYYTSDKIIDTIATFIADGAAPQSQDKSAAQEVVT
jgi:hypothetical protein